MAFLAVLREGFETAVFLLATFHASGDATTSWLGAVLGIVLAAAIGYGIYRGGVRLNLARFFRITGLVLVVVAAGLVMTAFHTANEAGWLTAGQAQAVRPVLAGPAGHAAVVAADRRAWYPALPGVDRGHRLARLPGADGRHRGLASTPPAIGRPPCPQPPASSGAVIRPPGPMVRVDDHAQGPVRPERWPAQKEPYPVMRTDGNSTRHHAILAAIVAGLCSRVAGCASSHTAASSGGSGVPASSGGVGPGPGKTTTVTVKLTPQGCAPKPATVPAGEVTFNVANQDAGAVTEAELRTADLSHILGEQENLTPGPVRRFHPRYPARQLQDQLPGREPAALDPHRHRQGHRRQSGSPTRS